jgi:hypothetical protein
MSKSIKYNENIKNFSPGESIPLFSLCYIDFNTLLYIASKQNPDKSIVSGIYIGQNQLQTSGKVYNSNWNLTPGLTCYLGNDGSIIQNVDLILSVYGETTVTIGRALSATSIDLHIESPVQMGGEALPNHIVRAQFNLGMGASYPLTVGATIPITTIQIDTHNAISGGQFIAPMDGTYLFDGVCNTISGTLNAGDFTLALNINGVDGGGVVNGAFILLSNNVAGVSADLEGSGSRTLSLNKNDVITFVVPGNAINTSLHFNVANFSITLLSTPFYQGNTTSLISGIHESGSNSNGSWIKYSDGTMECYHILTNVSRVFTVATPSAPSGHTVASANTTWTFPVSFVGTRPCTQMSGDVSWGAGLEFHGIFPTASPLVSCSCEFTIGATAGATLSVTTNLYAIGRWKV